MAHPGHERQIAPVKECHGNEVEIMRHSLDTSKTAFTVTKATEPKTESGGSQAIEDENLPEW